jgi:hypothetical protein
MVILIKVNWLIKMSKGIDEYTNQKSVRNTVLNQNTKTAKLL